MLPQRQKAKPVLSNISPVVLSAEHPKRSISSCGDTERRKVQRIFWSNVTIGSGRLSKDAGHWVMESANLAHSLSNPLFQSISVNNFWSTFSWSESRNET